jgi:hypothetical protein
MPVLVNPVKPVKPVYGSPLFQLFLSTLGLGKVR